MNWTVEFSLKPAFVGTACCRCKKRTNQWCYIFKKQIDWSVRHIRKKNVNLIFTEFTDLRENHSNRLLPYYIQQVVCGNVLCFTHRESVIYMKFSYFAAIQGFLNPCKKTSRHFLTGYVIYSNINEKKMLFQGCFPIFLQRGKDLFDRVQNHFSLLENVCNLSKILYK